MKQSQLFTKTRKDAPSDEVSKNAQLLIRAGFIHKEMAGVYSWLPLGKCVLSKVKQIIRDEMNGIGGQEIEMTALQDKELWQKTDRWDDEKVDNWFKTTFKNGGEVGLGITHEEPITRIMKNHISSYRDLPRYAYQFQTKFRNETRAKSGVIRGREFLMKDLYDFSRDEAEHNAFYNQVRDAYLRVCDKLGIGKQTYVTYASGGIFSESSEEFQTVSDAGEDTIYVNEETRFAINEEMYTDENLKKLGIDKSTLVAKKSIETGNIFHLGTRFSEPLGLSYTNETGEQKHVFMGSYGFGPTRVVGTIVEVFADDKGLVWPENVAPFKIHLVELSNGDEAIKAMADSLYADLLKVGVEVLYDDRDARAGEKFADSDLIGVPYRIVIGKKSTPESIEVIHRSSGTVTVLTHDAILRGEYAV